MGSKTREAVARYGVIPKAEVILNKENYLIDQHLSNRGPCLLVIEKLV